MLKLLQCKKKDRQLSIFNTSIRGSLPNMPVVHMNQIYIYITTIHMQRFLMRWQRYDITMPDMKITIYITESISTDLQDLENLLV